VPDLLLFLFLLLLIQHAVSGTLQLAPPVNGYRLGVKENWRSLTHDGARAQIR
jgi:hypothetical protein